jgi:hypothetical protein
MIKDTGSKDMEQLEVILSIGGTAVGFLATAVTFCIKFIKSAKAKKIAEQTLRVTNAVLPFIEQAETFLNYSGSEKKEFVLTKANQFAIDNGIKFNAESVGAKIEELVGLTKEVNKREKDQYKSDSAA